MASLKLGSKSGSKPGSKPGAEPNKIKKRRTQEERSAQTQEALMQATTDALYETGYARMSMAEVAARAGVPLPI